MRGVARPRPIVTAYPGGLERDLLTLDVHRRQLDPAMRHGDAEALDGVLDEHFRLLEDAFSEGIGRDRKDLFGPELLVS